MKRIGFVTSAKLASLTEDDRLAVSALTARGFEVSPAVWDQAGVEWKSFDALVIRSVWDYHRRLSEFLGWVARQELQGARLWNPSAVLLWNSSKTYLGELERAGVALAPTLWLQGGKATSAMLDAVAATGWDRFVIKPAVSAGGLRTHRFTLEELRGEGLRRAEIESVLAEFEPGSVILVQKYCGEIEAEGEWSFLFFGGAFSHAALKRPAAGEFRVQTEHGGSLEAVEAPGGAVEWAQEVVARAEAITREKLLYARVDAVRRDGQWTLMELEALEPALYLGLDPEAPGRLADAIAKLPPLAVPRGQ